MKKKKITTTTDSEKMFEAVLALNLPKGPSNNAVHDEHGRLIATETGKAAVVAVYLEHQLTGDEPPLEPFVGLEKIRRHHQQEFRVKFLPRPYRTS